MAALFTPFAQRGRTMRNRVALSPMCMYSSHDGFANDWHLVHLGARAAGGCGLVMTEATAVEPQGRITPQDLGIWQDEHIETLAHVVRVIQGHGALAAIQLAHAGRKAGYYRPWSPVRGVVPVEEGGWTNQRGPSPVAFREGAPIPAEMSTAEIAEVRDAFVQGARRAHEAGFDVIELHSAHGYLLHQFLSPISNRRTDEYGGDFAGRTRLHRELVREVRAILPEDKPLWMRISATDWVEGGWTIEESVQLARDLRALGLDLMDVSSGGSTPDAEIPIGPGFQVPFAAQIRAEADIATGAVGMLTTPEQANAIVAEGQADVVLLGRELLRNPYWPLQAASALGVPAPWPDPYQWAVG